MCGLCRWRGIAVDYPSAVARAAVVTAVTRATVVVPAVVAAAVVVAGAGQAEQGGRAVLVVRRGHDDRLHAVAELGRVAGVDALREVLVAPVLRRRGLVDELSPDLRRDA